VEESHDRNATITAIVAPDRGKRRVIHLDGEPWRQTSSDALKHLDLDEGLVVHPEALAERLDVVEPEAVRSRALRILEARDRSIAELSARLVDDGYPEHVVESLVQRLAEVGVVCDERLAESLILSLARGKGYGDRRIRQELRRRGIPDGVAEACLLRTERQSDDERAEAMATRFATSVRDPHKLAQRLVRRGFDWEVARRSAASALQSGGDTHLDRL
jgi:regulatory protein